MFEHSKKKNNFCTSNHTINIMKPILILLFFFNLFTACNKIERGTLDSETSSRKLYDTVRDNAFEKSTYLMPDKGTFRKIEEQKEQKSVDVNAAYKGFSEMAEQKFNATRSLLAVWDKSKFLHSTVVESKYGNLPAALVTVKFEAEGDPYKFQYTSVKFNNRWYYMGDITWVAKSE